MTTLSTNPTPPVAITDKLRDLRSAVTRWLLVAGFSRWLIWLVGLLLGDFLLDYVFRLDFAQRVLCGLAMITVLGVVLIRRVILPTRVALDDDALCARVESRHGDLKQRVITALQLSRLTDPQSLGVSPDLVAASVDQGVDAAASVDVNDVLDRKVYARNGWVLLGALVVLGVFAGLAAATDTGQTWFNRNILLGDARWPRDTVLNVAGVENRRVVIPRGDDYTVVVTAEGVVPAIVEIDFEPVEASIFRKPHSRQMTRIGESSNQFETTFANVIEPFRFRVRGGDDRGEWVTADLVDRPTVGRLKLFLTPPSYTGLGEQELPPGKSPYYVLTGSALRLHGLADKALSGASLRLPNGEAIEMIWSVVPQADALGDKPGWAFSAEVGVDRLKAGTYALELTDSNGLESKPPTRFALRPRPDGDPSVEASLNGIGTLVVSKARVPIQMVLADDYAITKARLIHFARVENEDTPAADEEPKKPTERTRQLSALKDKFGEKRIKHEHPFELRPLDLPVNATLGFHIEADDNDAVAGPKTGKSRMFYLTVVTEQVLRDDLLRREKEQREEFARLIKDQESMWVQARSIRAAGQNEPTLSRPLQMDLTRLQKRQALIADRMETIARQFAQLKAEVVNNRIEESGGPVELRLQRQIIDPLRELASDAVPPIAARLDQARISGSDSAGRDSALADAATRQEAILKRMRVILGHMIKWEGYQQALNLAYEIAGAQEKVNEATLKAIRDIFNEDLFPPEKPGDKPK